MKFVKDKQAFKSLMEGNDSVLSETKETSGEGGDIIQSTNNPMQTPIHYKIMDSDAGYNSSDRNRGMKRVLDFGEVNAGTSKSLSQVQDLEEQIVSLKTELKHYKKSVSN